MALPKLNQVYGYELQFFTNHIGHFLLVTGLIEALAADARVTMLSSGMHKFAPKGGIEFDNLSGEKGYSAWRAYGQSKMANLPFRQRTRSALQRHGADIKRRAPRRDNRHQSAAFDECPARRPRRRCWPFELACP